MLTGTLSLNVFFRFTQPRYHIEYYTVNKKSCGKDNKFYYAGMPNQPAQDTVTISFTLPRALNEAIESESRNTLSNKSDIIRRALMAHLTPAERAAVLKETSMSYKSGARHKKLKEP